MSDPATESYITIFRNSGVAGIPCSEWEISDVQRELGVELPPAYKAFLAIAGNGFEPLEGSLYAGEDNLSELQRAGRRIAADEKTALLPGALPAGSRRAGVRFPPSYKAFLLQHGALFSSVGAISGVFPQSPLAANAGTVLGDTLYYREHFQLPADFVLIERDFDDNDTWCLDLSAASSNGECPVVCYGLKGGASKRLYASFGDCFNEW